MSSNTFPPLQTPPSSHLPPAFVSDWETETLDPLPDPPLYTSQPLQKPPPPELVPITLSTHPIETVPPPPPAPSIPPLTSRSGRYIRLPVRFDDSHHSLLHAHTATFLPTTDDSHDCLLQPSTSNYSEPHPMAILCSHMFAFIATDPETMTLVDNLQHPDWAKFILAIHKELTEHISRRHWKVVPLKNVPPQKRRLHMVWSTK